MNSLCHLFFPVELRASFSIPSFDLGLLKILELLLIEDVEIGLWAMEFLATLTGLLRAFTKLELIRRLVGCMCLGPSGLFAKLEKLSEALGRVSLPKMYSSSESSDRCVLMVPFF